MSQQVAMVKFDPVLLRQSISCTFSVLYEHIETIQFILSFGGLKHFNC